MPAPQPGTDFDAELHPAVALDAAQVLAWGFDYAWESEPSIADLVAVLVSNKTQFVCRYLSDAVPGGKGLTGAEAAALHAAGITICPNWEVSGTDFSGGYDAGLADGQAAAAVLRALGAPAGTYCWFSIDAGTSDTAATNAYLQGAKAGTGAYIAQLYGSYEVVEAAAGAGLGASHWQTYAWSGGQLSSHAALYQYENGVTIGSVSMDRDQALQHLAGPWADFGGVPAPAPHPSPAPPASWPASLTGQMPEVRPGSTGAAVRAVQSLLVARGYPVGVDGADGPQTTAALQAFQHAAGVAADGVAGPVTWGALAGALATVTFGDTGPDVRSAQALLTGRGYTVTMDGDYGPQTRSGITAFQHAAGIGADGITGPATWGKLFG